MNPGGTSTVPSSVAVSIVTYNSDRYIARCLESVLQQDYPVLRIVVVDNASSDNTLAALRDFASNIAVIRNSSNTGFAAAQNQAIAACKSDWVLTLNPDVRLTPSFISELVRSGEIMADVGTVCGKLLAMDADFGDSLRNPSSIRLESFSLAISATSIVAAAIRTAVSMTLRNSSLERPAQRPSIAGA